MSNMDNFNETKSLLTSIFQALNYDASTINSILTDSFINGLLDIEQQWPLNNACVSFITNLSNTITASQINDFKYSLRNELSNVSYLSSLWDYIKNALCNNLENAGVTGINLNYTSQNTTDANNNEHKQTGTFTTTDNTTSTITDVWFDAELSDTKDKTDVELSETISALPDVEGWGNVHNLINVNDNQVLLLMSV